MNVNGYCTRKCAKLTPIAKKIDMSTEAMCSIEQCAVRIDFIVTHRRLRAFLWELYLPSIQAVSKTTVLVFLRSYILPKDM